MKSLRNLAITYLLIVLLTFIFQEKLLYFPHYDLGSPASYDMPESTTEISLTAADETKLTAWYSAPTASKETIIFYHGNGGHLGSRLQKYRDIVQRGYGLLALSYRGYGTSEGTPSEDGFYQDARAAINHIIAQGTPTSEIILYGESLGTGVATQIATEYAVKLVVLESPYTSIAEVAKGIYWYLPVDLILTHHFDSINKITHINAPLIVLHGEPDVVVPITFGKKLFAKALEPKHAVYFPNTRHNGHSLALNLNHIEKFLAKL